jgi:hypothetical protein
MTPIWQAIHDHIRHALWISEVRTVARDQADAARKLSTLLKLLERDMQRIIRLWAIADAAEGRFSLLRRRMLVAAQGGPPLTEDELAAIAVMNSKAGSKRPAHRPPSWRTDAKLMLAAAIGLVKEIEVEAHPDSGVPRLRPNLDDIRAKTLIPDVAERYGTNRTQLYEIAKKLGIRSSD